MSNFFPVGSISTTSKISCADRNNHTKPRAKSASQRPHTAAAALLPCATPHLKHRHLPRPSSLLSPRRRQGCRRPAAVDLCYHTTGLCGATAQRSAGPSSASPSRQQDLPSGSRKLGLVRRRAPAPVRGMSPLLEYRYAPRNRSVPGPRRRPRTQDAWPVPTARPPGCDASGVARCPHGGRTNGGDELTHEYYALQPRCCCMRGWAAASESD